MGKRKLIERLSAGRNRHVAYTLDVLAQSVDADLGTDGMLTIICTPRGLEFYRAGVLFDMPDKALLALITMADRLRPLVDAKLVAP